MVDYTRPVTQWADTAADPVTALVGWSWRYDSATSTYTLEAGRPLTRAGFVLDPVTGNYVMTPQVNGEPEVVMVQVGNGETLKFYA